jgi:hypothetical protein
LLSAVDRRRSCRRNIDQLEAFPPRGIGETVVERDDLERRGTSFGRNESRSKLQSIGRSQRMNAKKPNSILAHNLARFDLMPPVSELFQPIEGERGARSIEKRFALETGHGGGALHLRSPPRQHLRVSPCQRL